MQTLSVSNTYTGGTTISAGTLQLSSSGWIGSGNITNNGILTFNRSCELDRQRVHQRKRRSLFDR